MHERLRTLFQEAAGDVLNAHGAPASVEENVEFATLALAPNLTDFPALRAVRRPALLPVWTLVLTLVVPGLPRSSSFAWARAS